MLDGFQKVMYWAGLIIGTLLVLFVVGVVNNKTHGMTAVADGLGDVIRWAGQLIGQALGKL